jgi:hypothetical protein
VGGNYQKTSTCFQLGHYVLQLKTYILRIIKFKILVNFCYSFALNLQEYSYIFTNNEDKKLSKSLHAVLSRVVIECSIYTRALFYFITKVYCNVFKIRQ